MGKHKVTDSSIEVGDDKRRRRRLAPEVRQNQILDVASRLVVDEGVSAISMELLGQEAGVSKALVYSYFKNRVELLSALLNREIDRIEERGLAVARAATNFEELIRASLKVYLEHVEENGLILFRLMSDPQITSQISAVSEEGRKDITLYTAHMVRQQYNISDETMKVAVDLLIGVVGSAGDVVARTGAEVDHVVEISVNLILGGLARLVERDRLA